MLKTLIKKQMMEVGQFIFFDQKKNQRRTKKSLITYGLMLGALLIYLLGIFFFLSNNLVGIMVPIGLDWFYFLIMGFLGILYGIFASVFSTFSSLYLPKDNDLILSLPIKQSDIVIARLSGCYVLGIVYEAMIFLPAIIAYQIETGLNIPALLGSIWMMFAASLFVLALSALLGYVVAYISVRLKSKAFVTVAISLALFAAYWYVYMKILNGITDLVVMAETVGLTIQNKGYLLYQFGQACIGNISAILITTVFSMICAYLAYYMIQKSFVKIATMNKGEKKVVYKAQAQTSSSVEKALFRKELLRFTRSATYMLNCGFGTLFLVVCAVGMLFKQETITELLQYLKPGFIPLIICGMLCMLAGMNDITTPSISLEGKNIYILQTLPVDPWKVLFAKLKLQLILTVPPYIFASIVLCMITKVDFADTVLSTALGASYLLFTAATGLVIGLKFVNLNWSSETAAVKQSIGVLISLFGNWVLVASIGLLSYFALKVMEATNIMILLIVVFSILNRVTIDYLKTKGAASFSQL